MTFWSLPHSPHKRPNQDPCETSHGTDTMNAILPAQLSATTCSGHARRDTVTMHLCHPGDASVGVPGDACTVQLDVDSYCGEDRANY